MSFLPFLGIRRTVQLLRSLTYIVVWVWTRSTSCVSAFRQRWCIPVAIYPNIQFPQITHTMTKLKVKWQRKSAHLSWGCPLSVNAILLNVPGSYGFDSPDSKPDANALQCVIAVHVVLKICVVRRIHRVFWTGFGSRGKLAAPTSERALRAGLW